MKSATTGRRQRSIRKNQYPGAGIAHDGSGGSAHKISGLAAKWYESRSGARNSSVQELRKLPASTLRSMLQGRVIHDTEQSLGTSIARLGFHLHPPQAVSLERCRSLRFH